MLNKPEEKSLLTEMTGYIKNLWYMLSLGVCTLATYGYFLTHYAVSIDDLSADRYYYGELFAQGRFTNTIIHHLFGFIDNSPWIRDLCGLLLLATSAIVFCVLLDKFVQFKTQTPKIIFSCLLVSAPIFAELFSYNGTCISTGGGFLFVALSLYFTLLSRKGKRIKYLLLSSVLIAVTVSWYESLLVVYVEAVFALLILEYVTAKDKISLKTVVLEGLYFAIPLAIGVVAEFLIQAAVIGIFELKQQAMVSNSVELLSLGQIVNVIKSIFKKFFLAAMWHKTIVIFVASSVLSLALCIYYCVKKKSFVPILLFAGLIFTNFMLCFLSTDSVNYRTCQCFAFFTAFVVLFLLLSFEKSEKYSGKKLHKFLCLAAVYLIIVQISTSNYWYFWDYQRYEEEANTIKHISVTLAENYDISKPIVFTGEYKLSDEVLEHSYVTTDSFAYKANNTIRALIGEDHLPADENGYANKIPQTIVSSYINWGMYAFRPEGTELFNFIKFHGIDYLKPGTKEMSEEAQELAVDMPRWPQKGSILDVGEYIIVNF